MNSQIMFLCCALLIAGCRPKLQNATSQVMGDSDISTEFCATEIADKSQVDTCRQVVRDVYGKVKDQLADLSSKQLDGIFGEPLTIVMKKKCLAEGSDQTIVLRACTENDPTVKWHFADMEVVYPSSDPHLEIRSRVGYLVSRKSLIEWATTPFVRSDGSGNDHKSGNVSLKCIDFADPAQNQPGHLTQDMKLNDCSKTNLMFQNDANGHQGDANLDANNYYSFIRGLDLRAKPEDKTSYENLREELKKRKPILTEPCRTEGCLSGAKPWNGDQAPTNAEIVKKRLEMIGILENPVPLPRVLNSRFMVMRSNDYLQGTPEVEPVKIEPITAGLKGDDSPDRFAYVAGCVKQPYNKEGQCFEGDPRQAVQVYPFKNIYSGRVDRALGPVVQVETFDNLANLTIDLKVHMGGGMSGQTQVRKTEVLPNGCVLWGPNPEGKTRIERCDNADIDTHDGPNASQFRLISVATPPNDPDQRPRFTLQRVVNLLRHDKNNQVAFQTPKCLGLKNWKFFEEVSEEADCCSPQQIASGSCPSVQVFAIAGKDDDAFFATNNDEREGFILPDAQVSGERQIRGQDLTYTTPPVRMFAFKYCVDATNLHDGLQYDCGIDRKYARRKRLLTNLAQWLNIVPGIGNVFTFAIQAVMCHELKGEDKRQSCNSLGITAGMMILDFISIFDSGFLELLKSGRLELGIGGAAEGMATLASDPIGGLAIKTVHSVFNGFKAVDASDFATILAAEIRAKNPNIAEKLAGHIVQSGTQSASGIDPRLIWAPNELENMQKKADGGN